MSVLRVAWRAIAFVVFTSCMFVPVLITHVTGLFAPQSSRRARHRVFRAWARVISRLLGMRTRVEGPAPSTPFLLVANHLSYMDIVLLTCCLEAVFVAKSEVAHWPFLGPMVRSMNTIFVNRGNRRDLVRVNREIGEALAAGEGIVVFAEGTSSDGTRVLPFKPSMLQVALERSQPVHYARLAYQTPAGSPDPATAVCWWDDTPLLVHVTRLLSLPHFGALVHFGTAAVEGDDRKQLALVLREKICALPILPDQA